MYSHGALPTPTHVDPCATQAHDMRALRSRLASREKVLAHVCSRNFVGWGGVLQPAPRLSADANGAAPDAIGPPTDQILVHMDLEHAARPLTPPQNVAKEG